jgi:signal transduction histidine kinase
VELFKNSQHFGRRVEIVTEFHDPLILKSDPEQIKQVLWNLFRNACEAMPEGGSLHIQTSLAPDASQKDSKSIILDIWDTGKGFDERALRNLFVPFFTTKEGGSGLGLAIVKGIVEGLEGEMQGSNHPEGGARIRISLPLYPGSKPASTFP